MGKIAKGVNKINLTMLYGNNYCYIFTENFSEKFSQCSEWAIVSRPVAPDCTQCIHEYSLSFRYVLYCMVWRCKFTKIEVIEPCWQEIVTRYLRSWKVVDDYFSFVQKYFYLRVIYFYKVGLCTLLPNHFPSLIKSTVENSKFEFGFLIEEAL